MNTGNRYDSTPRALPIVEHKCSAPGCPGFPWRASERPHPCAPSDPARSNHFAQGYADAIAGSPLGAPTGIASPAEREGYAAGLDDAEAFQAAAVDTIAGALVEHSKTRKVDARAVWSVELAAALSVRAERPSPQLRDGWTAFQGPGWVVFLEGAP